MRNSDTWISSGRQSTRFQAQGTAIVKAPGGNISGKVAGTERMRGRILTDEIRELSGNQIVKVVV